MPSLDLLDVNVPQPACGMGSPRSGSRCFLKKPGFGSNCSSATGVAKLCAALVTINAMGR